MLGSRWWTAISWDEFENGTQDIIDAVLGRELFAVDEGDPCSCAVSINFCVGCSAGYSLTLIFAIATLHLLVDSLLDLTLENPRPRGLVVVGYLEDVRRIDPVVGAASHDVVRADGVLIDRHLLASQRESSTCPPVEHTLLYVAL